MEQMAFLTLSVTNFWSPNHKRLNASPTLARPPARRGLLLVSRHDLQWRRLYMIILPKVPPWLGRQYSLQPHAFLHTKFLLLRSRCRLVWKRCRNAAARTSTLSTTMAIGLEQAPFLTPAGVIRPTGLVLSTSPRTNQEGQLFADDKNVF